MTNFSGENLNSGACAGGPKGERRESASSRYQPYPEYKDSGVIGLDNIPTKWAIRKIKYLFNIGRGRVISQEELVDEGEYPVYSSQTVNDGCLGYISTYDFDCDQITWTTDGANAGTVFLRQGKHNCTNVCGTLQPRSNDQHLKYFLYCLQYVTQFYKRPDTNGAKIMNGEMAEIFVAEPTEPEKQKIANFLDHETAKIDTLIEQQQQLIQLLKEKRQAVISHAVTKGLNPNAPMKDSGVEWLGEVPEHWEVARLKNVLKINNGRDYKDVEVEDGGYPVYGSGGIFKRSSNFLFDGKSVLFGRKGTVDKPLLVYGKFWTVDTMFYSEIFNLCIPEFIHYQAMQFPFDLLSTSTALPSMTQEALLSLGFVYPSKNEQNKIIEFIQIESNKMDTVIYKANDAIQLMQERRTALISAAVTGKIDVRDWQAPAAKIQDVAL